MHLDLVPFLSFFAQAGAISTGVWLRLGGSAVVLALLYVALADPAALEDAEQLRKVLDVLRRSFFALLGAFVFFQYLSPRWEPEVRPGNQGKGFQSFSEGVLYLHFGYSRLSEMGAGPTHSSTPNTKPKRGSSKSPNDYRAEALENVEKAAQDIPESANIKRYCGLVQADRGDTAGALKTLNQAMDILQQRAPDRAKEERRIWTSLYGHELPNPQKIQWARERLASYQIGWVGDLGIAAAYRRLGEKAVPKDLKQQIADSANKYVYHLTVGGFTALFLIPQLGLIALVVIIVLVKSGVLRPAVRNPSPVAAILWESFILMFLFGALPGLLLSMGGKRPPPEVNPSLWAAILVSADAGEFLAVAYLWLRLKLRGLSLEEIGISRKNLGLNILLGVLAATVLIPTVYLIGIATQFISTKYFPNVAPPYHPLNGLTATSSSPEIRWALFTAAVIGAPLIEETFFRGCMFGALRRRHGFWVAILASSAFFAILHPQLPLGFLPIAVLGAAFAALYEWRQSLVPGMVAHAVNNGMATLLLTLLFPPRG